MYYISYNFTQRAYHYSLSRPLSKFKMCLIRPSKPTAISPSARPSLSSPCLHLLANTLWHTPSFGRDHFPVCHFLTLIAKRSCFGGRGLVFRFDARGGLSTPSSHKHPPNRLQQLQYNMKAANAEHKSFEEGVWVCSGVWSCLLSRATRLRLRMPPNGTAGVEMGC